MAFWADFRGEGLTWRSWCLALCALPMGCAQSFHIPAAAVPQVVEQYRSQGRVVLRRGGKRYALTAAQKPTLRVSSNTCVAGDCEVPEVPLEQVTALPETQTLRVPGAAPLRFDWLEGAEIVTNGRAARVIGRAGGARRSRLLAGLQLGGSAFAQFDLRYAPFEYLQLDLGFGAIVPELNVNGSAGLVSELRLKNDFAPYLGGGAGFGLASGPDDSGCEPSGSECRGSSTVSAVFGYGRVGIAKYLTSWHPVQRIGIDAGLWVGKLRDSSATRERDERFVWPMAGFSYHVAL